MLKENERKSDREEQRGRTERGRKRESKDIHVDKIAVVFCERIKRNVFRQQHAVKYLITTAIIISISSLFIVHRFNSFILSFLY